MELLLTVALIAFLVGTSAVVQQQALRLQETERVVETLRTEAVSARGAATDDTHDGPWGVRIEGSEIVMFHGAGYTSRDTTFDRRFEFNSEVSIGGRVEYVFLPPFGLPESYGITTVSFAGRSYVLEVSKYGGVEVR